MGDHVGEADDEDGAELIHLDAVLSISEKTVVFQHVLHHLESNDRLLSLANEHFISYRNEDSDLSPFLAHQCERRCHIREEDALASRQIPSVRPPRSTLSSTERRQRDRLAERMRAEEAEQREIEWWEENWPIVPPPSEWKDILGESLDFSTSSALERKPCSFCNRNEVASMIKTRSITDLDITLLVKATERLRTLHDQPLIQSHVSFDGAYNVCRLCWQSVKAKKFVRVPILSWANGCWIGDVPPELSGLTYVEELVIARAHTTKCWAKLNKTGKKNSENVASQKMKNNDPTAQRVASGNVCIHPHEIRDLTSRLPRPLKELKDEIVVIFVSEDRQATLENFESLPFRVRRQKILEALVWLKGHNPLYKDVIIDMDALNEYPDGSDTSLPLYVTVPERWRPVEGSPFRFVVNRDLQQRIVRYGCTVLLASSDKVWM
ncbi:hypothetical protein PQX77_004252 [Marasmius sp. AFHP31]|nr:hypothetical protein PQX77_007216 [Marasmius sp. AFHP31]KAK1232584.1 hypothetical protein PQX77_004252 [Marasmius sp. AFHP31]